jgi:hypothetical protein
MESLIDQSKTRKRLERAGAIAAGTLLATGVVAGGAKAVETISTSDIGCVKIDQNLPGADAYNAAVKDLQVIDSDFSPRSASSPEALSAIDKITDGALTACGVVKPIGVDVVVVKTERAIAK